MGRTKEQQREYMREYRARQRDLRLIKATHPSLGAAFPPTYARILELEEEVRHLKELLTAETALHDETLSERDHIKEELAKRPTQIEAAPGEWSDLTRFNTRPFTPVPKKGK